MGRFLRTSDEVARALGAGRPVVALESTLITHGLPRPLNARAALGMEEAVRRAGAAPATVAVLGGVVRVGLTADEIIALAELDGVFKVSSRGLSYAVVTGRPAATTVSGTLHAAALAGLRFFATGGLGGAHRGAQRTWDVSADLGELARVPVAVVCSGAKSILDLALTLERLDSLGVPVVGYGTDELPAFWTPRSGHRLEYSVSDAAEAARLWRTHRGLGLPGGMVFAVPPPAADADAARLEDATDRALREAEDAGVRGGEVTPWVLRRVAALTEGASVEVNVALLLNNARVAAEIAAADAP